jgi:hypothetical protein
MKIFDIFQDDRKYYPNKYWWLLIAGLKTWSYLDFKAARRWYWNKETLRKLA